MRNDAWRGDRTDPLSGGWRGDGHGSADTRAFALYPQKLVVDTARGLAEPLSWLAESEGVEPHIPMIDSSGR